MKDFSEIIERKFPTDGRTGFYAKPHLPASKTGKALASNRQIRNPSDVIAMHEYGGLFGGGVIVFTGTQCFYSKGVFALEDVKAAQAVKSSVELVVNQGGRNESRHSLPADNENAARMLADVFEAIIWAPKAADIAIPEADYSAYSKEAVNWLELRDEVLRTIDLLHQRFQDGKLSLLEYEEKKIDLLNRL